MITKKTLQTLVNDSYDGDELDGKTLDLLADHMNRQTLKQYISLIKQEEKKRQIVITSPRSLSDVDKKTLQGLFPKKKIMYILDPEMINGIQIVNNDESYEINLNKTFHDIIDHLSKYD